MEMTREYTRLAKSLLVQIKPKIAILQYVVLQLLLEYLNLCSYLCMVYLRQI